MKRSLVALLIAICVFISACGPELYRAVTETIKDTHQEVQEEYGKGAPRSMSRGTEGLISIEPYRSRVNNLYNEGRITKSERDRRLNKLFSRYDAYKSGRISQNAFERYANQLTTP